MTAPTATHGRRFLVRIPRLCARWASLLALLILAPPAGATVWRLEADGSGDLPSPQAAVDAAAAGDTLEFGPGSYSGTLVISGKPLALLGRDGAEATVLDPAGAGRVLVVANIPQGILVEGLTLRGGRALGVEFPKNAGGGVLCTGAGMEIRECVFEGNQAFGTGGAIHARSVPLGSFNVGGFQNGLEIRIADSVFRDNFAGDEGGALFCEWSALIVTGSRFERNQGVRGGAVSVLRQTAVFSRCEFRDNSARLDGGAVLVEVDGPVTVLDCLFSGNRSDRRGGAVHLWDLDSATLQGCVFDGETSANGGAVFAHATALTAVQCLWTGCAADQGGGAFVQDTPAVQWTRCTWIENQSPRGPSVYLLRSGALVEQCLVADAGAAVYCFIGATAGGPCNVRGPDTENPGCMSYVETADVARCPSDPAGLCVVPEPPGCGVVGHAAAPCGDPACLTAVESGSWGSIKTRFRSPGADGRRRE